ncbi:MAG: hypothetical protein ACK4RF_05980 [Cyclobacteriaceae bacterium]
MKRKIKSQRRNWVQLYVAGKGDFCREVMDALERSGLPFMPGYLYDTSITENHSMLWIDDSKSIEEYKRAIGAKLVWKYRLRFFSELSAFSASARPAAVPDEEFDTAA